MSISVRAWAQYKVSFALIYIIASLREYSQKNTVFINRFGLVAQLNFIMIFFFLKFNSRLLQSIVLSLSAASLYYAIISNKKWKTIFVYYTLH